MEKKNNTKLNTLFNKYIIILILTLFLCVVGATYAYFAFSITNTTYITGDAAKINLTLNITRVLPIKSNTEVIVPQKSISGEENSPLSTALKSGCVDDNNNVVCQVYKIYIKNDGGTATEIVDGAISFYADKNMTTNSYNKMPNLKWKLITSVDTSDNTNSILGSNIDNIASSNSNKFVSDVTLSTDDEEIYYMIIWFDEIDSDQIDSGNSFFGKIEFTSSNGTGVTASFSS